MIPKQVRRTPVDLVFNEQQVLSQSQRTTFSLLIIFILFWIIESILEFLLKDKLYVLTILICWLFLIVFCYFLFLYKSKSTSQSLLTPKDCFSGIPVRGVALIAVALVLTLSLVELFSLNKQLGIFFEQYVSFNTSFLYLFFILTLTVIFATEVLSNTVVSMTFFPIAYGVASTLGESPLIMMLTVALASTCAFMSPIATPVNSLAFAEMRGTSLKQMMLFGFVLNLIGACLMTGWLVYIIPFIY